MLGSIKAELAKPRLFEIGLRDKVELDTEVSRKPEDERRVTYAVLVALVLLGLGGLVTFTRFVPAMSAARLWLFSNKPAEAHFDTASKVVSGLEAAAFGFAVGMVIELCAPGSTGYDGALLLGVTTAAFFSGLPVSRHTGVVREQDRRRSVVAVALAEIWPARGVVRLACLEPGGTVGSDPD